MASYVTYLDSFISELPLSKFIIECVNYINCNIATVFLIISFISSKFRFIHISKLLDDLINIYVAKSFKRLVLDCFCQG